MNIAFVRGPHLNPWELQTYKSVSDRQNFVAIGADWQFYESPFENKIPIQKASVWGARLGRINPSLFVTYNRALSWILGRSYGFYDLSTKVANAEILHSAETFSTMTTQCLEIRRHRPCKVVATIWENLPHMGEKHPLRRARKYQALKELDGFLAVTETSRRMLIAEGAPPDKIEVISMGVDLAHFKPGPRSPEMVSNWNIEPNEKIVLFVGRWVDEKGIRELLRAIPDVLKAVPTPVRFCFVGAGPLQTLLRQAEQDFPGRLLLVPFASYDQLPHLHNMADVFVLPSKPAPKWQEQFGYVLAESMACGKAVVTTNSGSIPDVVGKAAVLVSPGNASDLASAIIKILNSESERQRLGQAALLHARENFDAEKNTQKIEAFYERVLRQPS